MTYNEQVDAYINNAPPFAKPILTHLRELVHKASPQITETIKWKVPVFEYKGMVCSMAAFKQHCALSIFKFKEMKDVIQFEAKNTEAAGQFGKITSLDNLPEDKIIISYLQEAVKLNENKGSRPKQEAATDKVLFYPEGMQTALENNVTAKTTFDKMSYSHQKEYVEWIAEAKTEATRTKRISTMLEWLEEGKRRNWKYEKP